MDSQFAAYRQRRRAVVDLGRLALETADLSVVMATTVAVVADTLGVEFCKILRLDPREDNLLLLAGVGWKNGLVGSATVGTEIDSQAGFTLSSNEPVIVEDTAAERRFSGPALLTDHDVVSGVSVVIEGHQGAYGVLGAHTSRRRLFSDDDVGFLKAVANTLTTAIRRKATDAQLQHSRDQLREAQKTEAIGRLAGGVAHDFNNLLTAIVGFTELAMGKTDETDPRYVDLREVVRAAKRSGALTAQLLAFGRRQVLQPRSLDSNRLVTELIGMLRHLLGEDIDLVTALDPDLGSIEVDPVQAEQVIVNLVINGRDAMPDGGTLTIETANVEFDRSYCDLHPDSGPGPQVMLAVSDTGVGMDAETKARIFEPFFTTKGRRRGTGLGLATVYGIVKQSGGIVRVDSDPGRGSTFRIYFPRVETPVPEAPASDAPRAAPAPAPARGATVLVVEDEASVLRLRARALVGAGYRVLCASDAATALRVGQECRDRIDLLLTDVVLPDGQGRDLAEQISAARPETAVLFMSGYADSAIVHHGVLDEDVAFLPKPFTPDTLMSEVRATLRARD